MSSKQCVLVLGMHRSGTSALAGCLNLVGMNLGNAIIPGDSENQSGYFENRDIILTHDILLRDLCCRWDMAGSLPQGWEKSQAARKASDTLKKILRNQFLNKKTPFVVKDPRLCRLLPLWKGLLEELEVRPSIILMLRHPTEVAKSLHDRNGIDLLSGHLLWLVHNREALSACRGLEHISLSFDQFLSDPVTTLGNAAVLPSLSGIDPAKHSLEILQFVQHDLKHYRQEYEDESKDELFRHYAWIYDQLISLHDGDREFGLSAMSEEGGPADSLSEKNATLPLLVSDSRTLSAQDDRRHTAEIFDSILSIIGRFERAELDHAIQRQRRILAAESAAETLFIEVYFPNSDFEKEAYSKDNSLKLLLAPEEWQQVLVDIPNPCALRKSRLRIDPLNTRGVVSISGVSLVNAANGDNCWSAPKNYSEFQVDKDALVLANEDGLQIAAIGNNSRILLPVLPDLPDGPMRLQMWIKPARVQNALRDYFWKLKEKQNEFDDKLQKQEELTKKYADSLSQAQNEFDDKLQMQEELTKKYADSLVQAEKEIENFKGQSSIREQALKDQEDLTRQYFQALADAEEEQEKLRTRFRTLENQNKDLNNRLKEINKQFTALLSSKRFRLGNAIGKYAGLLLFKRPKQPDSATRIREKLREPEKYQKSASSLYTRTFDSGQELFRSMDRLHNLFQLLMRSRRWKMGNAVVSIASALALRFKKPNSVNRMQKIFSEFQEWKKTVNPAFLTNEEMKQLRRWMDRLETDFKALLTSRRLRLGNSLAAPAKLLRWREKRPKATDRMKEIFNQHNPNFIKR